MANVFLLITGVAITSPLLAGPLSFGVEGGADFSNVDKAVTLNTLLASQGFQTTGFTSIAGFTGGAFGEWQFQSSFSLRAEVFYSMKGTQIKTISPLGYSQEVANWDYLEIPVVIRYQLPLDWGIKPSLFVGASYGTLLQAQQTTTSNSLPTIVNNSSSGFNPSDFNFVGGIEADWEQWLLNIRYSLGLSQIYTGNENGVPYTSAHNITLTILAGYRIW